MCVSFIFLKCSNVQFADKEIKVNTDILCQFVALLQQDKIEISEKVAEIIATLAKKENHREVFSDSKVVSKLCQILDRTQINKDNLSFSVAKQTCRALGNLCYENGMILLYNYAFLFQLFYLIYRLVFVCSDKCRKCVVENNGVKVITETVKQAVALGNSDRGAELRSCAVGLLLNLVAGYEDLDPVVRSNC